MINLLAQVPPEIDGMGDTTIILIVVGFVAFVIICVFLYFFKVWIRALASGVRVPMARLIGMKLRRVPPSLIIDGAIMAVKAGLDVSTNDLETHYLAGGNVRKVVQALVAARKANIELDFKTAAAMDLAGEDVLKAARKEIA